MTEVIELYENLRGGSGEELEALLGRATLSTVERLFWRAIQKNDRPTLELLTPKVQSFFGANDWWSLLQAAAAKTFFEYNVDTIVYLSQFYPEEGKRFEKTCLYLALSEARCDWAKLLIAGKEAQSIDISALRVAAETCDFELFKAVYDAFPHLLHDYVGQSQSKQGAGDAGEERERRMRSTRREQVNPIGGALTYGRALDLGQLQILHFILEKEPAYANLVDGQNQESALHMLAENHILDLDYWKLFLDHMDASMKSHRDRYGLTAFQSLLGKLSKDEYTETSGLAFQLVEYLLKHEEALIIDAITSDDESANNILCAVVYIPGNHKVVEYLLKVRPSLIDHVNFQGRNAMHLNVDPLTVPLLHAARPSLVNQLDKGLDNVFQVALSCEITPDLIENLLAICDESILTSVNSTGENALQTCVRMKREFVLFKLLLDKNESALDNLNFKGENILHIMAHCDSRNVIEEQEKIMNLILSLRPQFLCQFTQDMQSPLSIALRDLHQYSSVCREELILRLIESMDETAVKALLKEQPQKEKLAYADDDTVLGMALEKGRANIFAALLAKEPGLIHHVTTKGNNLLHTLSTATEIGDTELAFFFDLLTTRKPKLVYSLNDEGQSPLHTTSLKLFVKLVLDKFPAAIYLVDYQKNTPLHTHASEYTGKDILRLLIRAAPDLGEALNSEGWSMLHSLCSNSNPDFDCLEVIVNQFPQLVNLKDAKERKPYYVLLTEHLYCDVNKTFEKYFSYLFERTELTEKDIFTTLEYSSYRMMTTWELCVSKYHNTDLLPKLVFARFPTLAIDDVHISHCIKELNWKVVRLIIKQFPRLGAGMSQKVFDTIHRGGCSLSDPLSSQQVVNILRPKDVYSLFRNEPQNSIYKINVFHETFLEYFVKMHNTNYTNINIKDFWKYKTFQLLYHSRLTRTIVTEFFGKRNIECATVLQQINRNFLRLFAVCKRVHSVFARDSAIEGSIFQDIFYKIAENLGPLSLWTIFDDWPLFDKYSSPWESGYSAEHTYKEHAHPLEECLRTGFKCNDCGKEYGEEETEVKRYRCYSCAHDACSKCFALMPKEEPPKKPKSSDSDEGLIDFF